ncbi:3-hydroxyisobutyrate dehydrogenase, partial [Fusarium oxysporum f. sp. albedinis]
GDASDQSTLSGDASDQSPLSGAFQFKLSCHPRQFVPSKHRYHQHRYCCWLRDHLRHLGD